MTDVEIAASPVKINRSLWSLVVPEGELRLDPKNARRHPDANLLDIERSIAEDGQQKPIVVSSAGIVLAGNGTLTVMRRLGATCVARVVYDGPTKVRERKYAIRDNRSAEKAEWDPMVLVDEIVTIGDDPELLGFSAEDLRAMNGEPAAGAPPAPPPLSPPVQFSRVGADVAVDKCCPRCGFKGSGNWDAPPPAPPAASK